MLRCRTPGLNWITRPWNLRFVVDPDPRSSSLTEEVSATIYREIVPACPLCASILRLSGDN